MELKRNPTLESILMVETTIEKNEGKGPYQIWKDLPRGMSYQAFQTILEYLEESGKIKYDIDNKILLREQYKDIHERVFNHFLFEIKRELWDEIDKVILFGSVARGDYGPDSDIDVLIVLKTNNIEKRWEINDTIGDIVVDILINFNLYVSPKLYTKKEFEKMKKHLFYEEISKEMKIYE